MLAKRIFRLVFFSNTFYGVCAVALSAETFVQLGASIKQGLFYLLVFAATVFYYSLAYLKTENIAAAGNERTAWYIANRKGILWMQAVLFLLMLTAFTNLFFRYNSEILNLPWFIWAACGFTLVCILLYYGNNTTFQLRNIGWLKPFSIACTWAVLVTLFPSVYLALKNAVPFAPNWKLLAMFANNFMFVATLCIMFDIKDYAMDYNQELKTFVVKYGLRKTIRYILLPMSLAGLLTFLVYAFSHHFGTAQILLTALPYMAVIIVAYSLHKRKTIVYYLFVIDGLMLLKAFCGSISALLN